MEIFDYLKESIPADHCRQSLAVDCLQEALSSGLSPTRLLDFGCGNGE